MWVSDSDKKIKPVSMPSDTFQRLELQSYAKIASLISGSSEKVF